MAAARPDAQKKIVLGVSGGISAYKAAEIVRRLQERGFRVQVAMTAHAREFVAPLTFAALTREKVITTLFEAGTADATLSSAIEHIAVAEEAGLLLVAPATASVLAKFANGLADDFLTTMYLAYKGPAAAAPAMNVNMWEHPATQRNVETLRARGMEIIEPDAGDLACGMTGPGRLAATERIVEAVERILSGRAQDLAGLTVLVTAGPTREPLDPVRYLTNRSSGRMGYALAAEAAARGAQVLLISGPTALDAPAGCEIVRVETAAQMRAAVLERLASVDLVMMAAAVADYRPAAVAPEKIKKGESALELALEKTPDILAELGRIKGSRVLVGFAAETGHLREHAEEKLRKKNCDFLVANLVGEAAGGTGFDSDDNRGLILSNSGETIEVERVSKREMAKRILDAAAPAALTRRAAAAR